MQQYQKIKNLMQEPFFQYLLLNSNEHHIDFQEKKISIKGLKDRVKATVLKNRLNIKKVNIEQNNIKIWI